MWTEIYFCKANFKGQRAILMQSNNVMQNSALQQFPFGDLSLLESKAEMWNFQI